MKCCIPGELVEKAISFHGHSCPGLTIGIRAAEYALQEFPKTESHDLVCIAETDMCAVDGIQFLTGCTFGKGNLMHLDYGKAAFSFYDRKGGGSIRLILRHDAKERNGRRPADKAELIEVLMDKALDQIFDLQPLRKEPPRSARVLQSLVCQKCREETMESRTRRFDGETLCIPCFEKVEQKK